MTVDQLVPFHDSMRVLVTGRPGDANELVPTAVQLSAFVHETPLRMPGVVGTTDQSTGLLLPAGAVPTSEKPSPIAMQAVSLVQETLLSKYFQNRWGLRW